MSSSSSESERSFHNEHSDSGSEHLHIDSGDEDILVVNSVVTPYENEPLANAAGEQNFVSVEEDADGFDPKTLEARFEGTVTLDKWQVIKYNARKMFKMLFCQCFVVNKHNIMRIKYIISVLFDLQVRM